MTKADVPTWYVFHGDDDFTRNAAVTAMRAQMGTTSEAELNIIDLDGTQTTIPDLMSAAEAFPFLSDKRLVVVDGMLTWLARKGAGKDARATLDTLITRLTTLPEYTRLVFAEPGELAKTHPIFKALQTDSHSFQKAFLLPEARDMIKSMSSWIAKRASHYNATIEPPAAVALATLIGADHYAADTEIDKLAIYVNGERPINEADIDLLTATVAESNLFQLVDALGARRGREAITILHRLLDARQEPLAMLGMINRQFRLLLQAKSHIEGGGDARDLPKLIGIAPFISEKLITQTRNFSVEQLEAIYRTLLDIDFKIKTGQVNGILALDLLIAELAA